MKLVPFSLPLVQAITVGGITQTRREGFLLSLTDDEGYVGYGEVSPLPGLHQESLEEVKTQLRGLSYEHQPNEGLQENLRCWHAQSTTSPPSLQFGVSMAIANHWQQKHKRPWATELHPTPPSQLPVQALVWGTPDEMISTGQQRQREGYKTLKVKVGRHQISQEAHALRNLSEALGPDMTFRLDANRGWSLAEAETFSKETEGISIEFIEEPLHDHRLLIEWDSVSQIPLALDESLLGVGKEPPQYFANARAVVLKPQLLGWGETQRWLTWAKECGKEAIFSSCFESGLGLAFLEQWASSQGEEVKLGLDTQRWFKQDLLPPLIKEGHMSLAHMAALTNAFEPAIA